MRSKPPTDPVQIQCEAIDDLTGDLRYRAEEMGPKVCLSIVRDLEAAAARLRAHFEGMR